jgi:hypothetical protein
MKDIIVIFHLFFPDDFYFEQERERGGDSRVGLFP